ncbi:MAG: molybdenum cofactor guanylyltransferase [Micavibrio sp.]
MNKTAGIVLAGGRSSRMGSNKALLHYQNVPLIQHMQNLLWQADINNVFISGDIPEYDCIHDTVRHDGPAKAMYDLLRRFRPDYRRVLFVPVDMPLLQADALRDLLARPGSVYYSGYPLPACLVTGSRGEGGDFRSVRDLLTYWKAESIPFTGSPENMANINTQQEWREIAS